MTAVRAAIVIVNYNGGALLEDAVRSALAQDVRRGAEAAFPVVVVDNASSDGSPERLAAFGDRITLIRVARATPGTRAATTSRSPASRRRRRSRC